MFECRGRQQVQESPEKDSMDVQVESLDLECPNDSP